MTWIPNSKGSADSIPLNATEKIFAYATTLLFPVGIRKQVLFLGNRLIVTMLRMIDPENTNIEVEESSPLVSQLSTESCKFSYLIADYGL